MEDLTLEPMAGTPPPLPELSQAPQIDRAQRTTSIYPTENFLRAQAKIKPILKNFSIEFHNFVNSVGNLHDRKLLFQDYNTIKGWLDSYVITGGRRKTKKRKYSNRK